MSLFTHLVDEMGFHFLGEGRAFQVFLFVDDFGTGGKGARDWDAGGAWTGV